MPCNQHSKYLHSSLEYTQYLLFYSTTTHKDPDRFRLIYSKLETLNRDETVAENDMYQLRFLECSVKNQWIDYERFSREREEEWKQVKFGSLIINSILGIKICYVQYYIFLNHRMPWIMEYFMSAASYWLYIIAIYAWIFMYSAEAVDPPKSNKSFQSDIKDSIPNSTEFIRLQLNLINEHSEKMESFRMRCQTAVLLQMRTFIIASILFIFYFLFRQYHETEENEHAWVCILACFFVIYLLVTCTGYLSLISYPHASIYGARPQNFIEKNYICRNCKNHFR